MAFLTMVIRCPSRLSISMLSRRCSMRSWILHSSLPSMSLNRMVIADPERLAVQREDALALIVLDLVVVADGDHLLPHLVARGGTVEPPLLPSLPAEQRHGPVIVSAPLAAATSRAHDPVTAGPRDHPLQVIRQARLSRGHRARRETTSGCPRGAGEHRATTTLLDPATATISERFIASVQGTR